ncbi:hypothetical protein ACFX19_038743 [Malus domestica]
MLQVKAKKKSSSPAREPLVEKKLRTSSTAREGPSTYERLMIDLTSYMGKKEAARSEPMKPAVLKVVRTVVDKIVQWRNSALPLCAWFYSKTALCDKVRSDFGSVCSDEE